VAQLAGQFKQEVATHFSISGSGAFFFAETAPTISGIALPTPAITTAPTTAELLRKARRLTLSPFDVFFLDSFMSRFYPDHSLIKKSIPPNKEGITLFNPSHRFSPTALFNFICTG
jgi:hypothetical protein